MCPAIRHQIVDDAPGTTRDDPAAEAAAPADADVLGTDPEHDLLAGAVGQRRLGPQPKREPLGRVIAHQPQSVVLGAYGHRDRRDQPGGHRR